MKYKLVIFDLDGTLSDSFPWFLSIVNSLAEKHRFRRIESDQIDGLRSYDSRQLIKHLGVSKWRLPAIMRDMRRLKTEHLHAIPLFPGVDQLLQAIKAHGLVLAMVSSDSEANVRRALGAESAGLIEHFACGASLFGKPAKFAKTLKASGVPASQTICIGDEVRDSEAARKVGLHFGAVSWGYASPETLQACAPDEIFSSIDDMRAKLCGYAVLPRQFT
jgi:phosphoglycolate phosphatase